MSGTGPGALRDLSKRVRSGDLFGDEETEAIVEVEENSVHQ